MGQGRVHASEASPTNVPGGERQRMALEEEEDDDENGGSQSSMETPQVERHHRLSNLGRWQRRVSAAFAASLPSFFGSQATVSRPLPTDRPGAMASQATAQTATSQDTDWS